MNLRSLAIKLYEAGQAAKRKQAESIWGPDRSRKWRDLPSESVAVWEAIALCAYRHPRKAPERGDYGPSLTEIPKEILDAARLVEYWMKQHGYTDWKLMGIQSRKD